MTNGPLSAHLISGATVSTKTSYAKFDIVVKVGVIKYINVVELEYIQLLAKFHDHRTISFVGENF